MITFVLCNIFEQIRQSESILDFWSFYITLESNKTDFFLAKNPFNKIAKKRYDHCMAYTAPDATKTKTLGTTYDQQ